MQFHLHEVPIRHVSAEFLTERPCVSISVDRIMLAFRREDAADASPSRWRPLSLSSKTLLPLEDCVVVAGHCASSPTRQLTGIGGHVKPSSSALLLLLPLPCITTHSATAASGPAIQVLEVGEAAVHFLQDIKACFPSLVRKNPLAADDDDDDDSDEDSDADEDHTRKKRKANDAVTEKAANSQSDATAAFLAKTRVRVFASADALREAYDEELLAVVQRNASSTSTGSSIQYLCIEFPPNVELPPVAEKPLNFGVVFVRDRDASSSRYLEIPLLRKPDRMFVAVKSSAEESDDEEEDEDVVFQDATVFTFATKRESSEHGGGKTSAETVKNIRLRHASGTFCTLVLPTMEWRDVVHKYSDVLPQVQELQGELRSRRFMGVVSNRPIEILLEDQ